MNKKSNLLKDMKHPMQPIGFDERGTIRFKRNSIIDWLFEEKKIDLNQIAGMVIEKGGSTFSVDDYTHLMQLLGYSISGYSDLSTSPSDLVNKANKIADDLIQQNERKENDG